jgi:DNA helicase-2/ATP-dependent DNA helicase PcrA
MCIRDRIGENPGYAVHLSQLRKIREIEDLFYPNSSPEETSMSSQKFLLEYEPLLTFASKMRRWHKAAALPIDQLVLVMANDLFTESHDLALAHKLSLTLESAARNHPEYRLPQFITELTEISHNERKFQGFSADESGFNPELHKGKVLVSTFHKAKGLEWDRVYLMSVNNYDFPSLQENDQYKSEKWFVREKVNLEAEVLSFLKQIGNLTGQAPSGNIPDATSSARQAYAAERLRLFFVGITRARESLIITWNTGRRENCTKSLPLQALEDFRKEVGNVTS